MAGGLAPRCQNYIWNETAIPDVIIQENAYRSEKYPGFTVENIAYMESARLFCGALLDYNGFYLHSSAVALDGKAYLFSANSGVGKSTHTRLWQHCFGEKAQVFNDDKPALRCIDGIWYAYGTPWCGKDGINQNMKVPIAGICFLKQAHENKIRRLTKVEALSKMIPQTIYRFRNEERMDLLLKHFNDLLEKIPFFELENKPEPEAAILSYETMHSAVME